MNFYIFEIQDDRNYFEVGVVKASSLANAQLQVDQVLEGGPCKGVVRPLGLDEYDMSVIYATPRHYEQ